MAVLTYGVTTGMWGTVAPDDLANNETFGTWGAMMCVALVVTQSGGTLFCAHISCGYTGNPANKQAVIQGTTDLLNEILGAANQGQPYQIAGTSGADPTSQWITQAINAWFTDHAVALHPYDSIYFHNIDGAIHIVADNTMTDCTNNVDMGEFEVNP
jgi:hypothetical protein